MTRMLHGVDLLHTLLLTDSNSDDDDTAVCDACECRLALSFAHEAVTVTASAVPSRTADRQAAVLQLGGKCPYT